MPNHIGSFLKASKCFSELGINVTRVSYNKAVDYKILVEADNINEAALLLHRYQIDKSLDGSFHVNQIDNKPYNYNDYDDYIYD